MVCVCVCVPWELHEKKKKKKSLQQLQRQTNEGLSGDNFFTDYQVHPHVK